jgi:hypothetical protein
MPIKPPAPPRLSITSWLAQPLGQALRDEARGAVESAARRERHDQTHRLVRINCGACRRSEHECQTEQVTRFHCHDRQIVEGPPHLQRARP